MRRKAGRLILPCLTAVWRREFERNRIGAAEGDDDVGLALGRFALQLQRIVAPLTGRLLGSLRQRTLAAQHANLLDAAVGCNDHV